MYSYIASRQINTLYYIAFNAFWYLHFGALMHDGRATSLRVFALVSTSIHGPHTQQVADSRLRDYAIRIFVVYVKQ